MSRKVRNIIFYIFIGCVAALFLLAFIVGIIYGFAGAGSKVVIGLRNFFIALGNADASFVKYSPYICIGAGLVLTFSFIKSTILELISTWVSSAFFKGEKK